MHCTSNCFATYWVQIILLTRKGKCSYPIQSKEWINHNSRFRVILSEHTNWTLVNWTLHYAAEKCFVGWNWSSSDMFCFCHFDLHLCRVRCCVCYVSENWKLWSWMINSSSLVQIFLGNFVGKYWKRRSFVMIVNSAMLTVKTDEIGAAIWSQKAQQQNACSEFVIYVQGVFYTGSPLKSWSMENLG